MSLSMSTLAAIQKVGAAAFTADEKLKKEARQYAERVHAAITNHPYNLGNDNLIENWKLVARLSQTLAGIEEELKKVYQVAAELTGEDQPSVRDVPVLAAPARSTGKRARKQAMTNTAVDVNAKQKAAKPVKAAVPKGAKVRKVPKAQVSKTALTSAPEKTATPGGNPAKLLAYLQGTLNTNEFSAINQTAVGKATGIALGSMTAAIKKLVQMGRIIAGPTGSYKLADKQPTVTGQ